MLFLMILGAASFAQVRIGGNGAPHGAAVLDLNADDTNNGTKTLALPRVRLTSTSDKMGNTTLLGGMLVYNTAGGSLSEGVYYWDGSQWVKPNSTAYTGSTSVTLSGTSFQRAALTGDVTATANNNATTIGDGKVTNAKIATGAVDSIKIASNAIKTVHINGNAVTSAKIADGTIVAADLADNSITSAKIAAGAVQTSSLAANAVTTAKIGDSQITGAKIDGMSAQSGNVLAYNGTSWAPASVPGGLGSAGGGNYLLLSRATGAPFLMPAGVAYYPVACMNGGTVGQLRPHVAAPLSGTTAVTVMSYGATSVTVCADGAACTCLLHTF